MTKRSRPAGRRIPFRLRRKLYGIRRKFRRAGNPQGFLKMNRKINRAVVSSGSGTLGTYTITAGQNCVALGTPVSVLGTNGLYDIPFSITARLDDVAGYTEVTNMFDAYKIVGLKVQVQGWNASAAPGTPLPYIQYDRDTDSNVIPTVSQFRERMGVVTKYITANRPAANMYFKPRVAPEVFATGLATAYAVPSRSMWLNTLNANVEHYCAVGVLRNVYIPAQAGVSTLTWEVTFNILAKDVQ